MIVCPHPVGCIVLNLLNGFKQIMAEPVVAYRSVKAFDVSILLWLARLDMLKTDTMTLGPGGKGGADVLGAIIAPNNLRFAPPFDDLLQSSCHAS